MAIGLGFDQAEDAEAVHMQRKPNTPYLESTNVQTFLAGPWPFGATRQTISKVLQTWGWGARPLQPSGKSADGQGILWTIQASGRPPYDVFQMSHADILISEVQPKAKSLQVTSSAVQGSARTIAALQASHSHNSNTPEVDP